MRNRDRAGRPVSSQRLAALELALILASNISARQESAALVAGVGNLKTLEPQPLRGSRSRVLPKVAAAGGQAAEPALKTLLGYTFSDLPAIAASELDSGLGNRPRGAGRARKPHRSRQM